MNLQLTSRWVGDVMVLTCAGRIVVGPEVDSLHDTVSRELEQQPNIVLQTADVQFVDSSGLGTMVRLMSAARAAGGDVRICQPPAMMRKALTNPALMDIAFTGEPIACDPAYCEFLNTVFCIQRSGIATVWEFDAVSAW
jgi:anti-anti-sigma factor